MLRMEEINAPIVLPELFKIEVKGWLNNNQKLFEQVNHQVKANKHNIKISQLPTFDILTSCQFK